MTSALATINGEMATSVTADQLDLIKRTIAKDATPDELKLYLYDCARQGVHPLDKLVHFTKRSGKYTPITSIDFMRIRAADSGEYAGNDDASFETDLKENGTPDRDRPPRAAQVTVWRIVQGTRCAFTATARWSEYKPEANDFMWKKMPHTMLAKCAEALALRKGFPRQLSGLYAKEEMDQDDKGNGGYTVEAPPAVPAILADEAREVADGRVDTASAARKAMMAGIRADTPGALYIERVTSKPTKNPNVTKYTLVLSDGREVGTIRDKIAALAEQCCQERTPVRVQTAHSKFGEDLTDLKLDQDQASDTDRGDALNEAF